MRLQFDFRCDGTGRRTMSFTRPDEVIETRHIDHVRGAIERADAARTSGAYVAGFVSYEAAPAFDAALTTRATAGAPLVWFGVFSKPSEVVAPPAKPADGQGRVFVGSSGWRPDVTREEYHAAVAGIRAAIAAGETYQANYTFRLRRSLAGVDPYALYQRLLAAHDPPYAAYLDIGDWQILSLSPELFFRVDGRVLTTRPMKGTARRGRFPGEDDERALALHSSPKDRAENVMIVDLMRNDVSRIAEVGTVVAGDLFAVERYASVLQMTSTVTGTLRQDVGLVDIFDALFPAGSITGAPKARTMRLLADVETTPRGPYCGAIGLLAPGGETVFNVAIRTMVVAAPTGAAEVGVGGAVTWDSMPASEWSEAVSKAGFLDVQPPFALVETLRLDAGRFARLDRHLARLQRSATYFGRPYDASRVAASLDAFAHGRREGAYRVRLQLDADGSATVDGTPLDTIDVASGAQDVTFARSPVASDDVFLFHKTTHRAVYESRRADRKDLFDVLLWNERGDVTEFTIGNVVLEIDGLRVTPPVECGLLAGVFRETVIESGGVTVRTITRDDVRRASRLWLVNSVREWVPVRLVA